MHQVSFYYFRFSLVALHLQKFVTTVNNTVAVSVPGVLSSFNCIKISKIFEGTDLLLVKTMYSQELLDLQNHSFEIYIVI